jgi:hypothetical protein
MNPSTLGSHELGADVRFFECNRERRSLRGDLRGVGLYNSRHGRDRDHPDY